VKLDATLSHYKLISLVVTLTFDLWPWNRYSDVLSYNECFFSQVSLKSLR